MAPQLSPTDIIARVNRDIERSALRARNGLRYVRGDKRAKVGITPKEVVWERDRAQLWRYQAPSPIRYAPPVVIVHSLVSRSYILDLRPGNSMVEHLLGAGLDVYLLDWGVPDERDAENGMETYVDDYIPRAVAAALRESDAAEVTLIGYCLGGLLAMFYSAGDASPVRNLITLAAPADFKEMGSFVSAVLEGRLEPEELIDETGNVPGDTLYSGFFMQAPTKTVAQYATLLENLWNDEFVEGYSAMAQWSREHIPFPGAAFRQMVNDLIRRDAVLTGSIRLGGRKIDFSSVRADVLVAMAERDNVVAPAAAAPLVDVVGDPARREVAWMNGGHVTFGTGRLARDHTWPRLTEWIQRHSDEHEPRER
jgi:polyhydroxyalkanoate synthase subunit PhaC